LEASTILSVIFAALTLNQPIVFVS
jgi:hypothetical protein